MIEARLSGSTQTMVFEHGLADVVKSGVDSLPLRLVNASN